MVKSVSFFRIPLLVGMVCSAAAPLATADEVYVCRSAPDAAPVFTNVRPESADCRRVDLAVPTPSPTAIEQAQRRAAEQQTADQAEQSRRAEEQQERLRQDELRAAEARAREAEIRALEAERRLQQQQTLPYTTPRTIILPRGSISTGVTPYYPSPGDRLPRHYPHTYPLPNRTPTPAPPPEVGVIPSRVE